MTDCLSCRHAKPAQGPDGRIDFNTKICVRMPPTPILLPTATPGQVSLNAMFPTVGKGVCCGEHDPRLIGEERAEGVQTQ